MPISWLPKINSPVMLAKNEEFTVIKDAVGHFPQTNYHAGINISDAVTHNTAILGILGIGKSCLSIELVERMVADNIKVICLDLTNQYKNELSDLIDTAYIEEKVTCENPVLIRLNDRDAFVRAFREQNVTGLVTDTVTELQPEVLGVQNEV